MLKKIIGKFKLLRENHLNAKMGRKLIGSDKFGNNFYQYYDKNGKETKRLYESNNAIEDNLDLYWHNWLRNKNTIIYSKEEEEKSYADELIRSKSAYNYEKKDSEMMEKFKKDIEKKKSEEKN